MRKDIRVFFFLITLALLATACGTPSGLDRSLKSGLYARIFSATGTVADGVHEEDDPPLAALSEHCPSKRRAFASFTGLCPGVDTVRRSASAAEPTWGYPVLAAVALAPAACDELTASFNPYLPPEMMDNEWSEYTGTDTLPFVPVVMNDNVESFITYYQTSGKPHFKKWLGRTRGYMDMVKSILTEEGVPEDLFYIALIESGLNPNARSRAGAVGMWQFIEGTAKRYGLRVDWWVDERQDPEKATRAAARYLKDLYNQFGSWYLAAAGYNTGEGRVRRAVARHNSTDFWELARNRRYFGRETRNYVPKYLAAMLIAKDPVRYGFMGMDFSEKVAYDKVAVDQPTDIKVIARAAGTTVEEIKRLNPGLLRWFTPPDYPGFEVKIPSGTKELYAANMEGIPAGKRLVFHRHKVRKGETLRHIARRYGTPLDQIIYLNEIKNPRLIYPGNLIVVPVRARDGQFASTGSGASHDG